MKKKENAGRNRQSNKRFSKQDEKILAVDNGRINRRIITDNDYVIINDRKIKKDDVVIIGEKKKNPYIKYLIIGIIMTLLLLIALTIDVITTKEIINQTINATNNVRATI